jgi:hypothetical protein
VRSLADAAKLHRGCLGGHGGMAQIGTDPRSHLGRGDRRLVPSSQVLAGGHNQVGGTTNQLEIVQKIC